MIATHAVGLYMHLNNAYMDLVLIYSYSYSWPEGQGPSINIGRASAWLHSLFLLHWNVCMFIYRTVASYIANVWQRKTLHDVSLLVCQTECVFTIQILTISPDIIKESR